MTKNEILKTFLRKTVLPIVAAALLYWIFHSACMRNGELDYIWLWILCGLPFGLHRMCLWIAGWQIAGQWDRLVCAELYNWWRNRWFCSGIAADCGGGVCAVDGVEADC